MQINLFEIIAQIVNFFILLAILQKFFYKPIQRVMKERQDKIDGLVEESKEMRKEADALIDEYNQKLGSIANKEQEAMKEAREKADTVREELLSQSKQEAEKRKEAFFKEIEEDKRMLERDIHTTLGKSSVQLASNILSYITDESLEEKMFSVLIKNINELDPSKQKDLLSLQEGRIDLVSANPLSQEQKKQLEEALKKVFTNLEHVDYTTDEDLILGYELKMESYLIRISIKKYLEQTEMNILKTIDSRY